MIDETLLTEVDGDIGWLKIHRPASRGAMTRAMWEALPDKLRALASHESVRVVVITGTEGNFIAGADISEFTSLRSDPELARRYDEGAYATLDTLESLDVPSIAMIGGPCVGGGVLIATGCDMRIAASGVRLGITAGRLGLAYPHGALRRLVWLLGEARALELLLTSQLISGEEAAALGLVNQAIPDEELEATVRKWCGRITRNAPLALRYARLAVRAEAPASRADVDLDAMIEACFASEDYQEGIQAFLDKRRPEFKGR